MESEALMTKEMSINLEALFNDEEGYLPLVLTKDWQMAQLNYTPNQLPQNLEKLDQHTFTDETFTMIKGRAMLITYDETSQKASLTSMEWGRTYNVPTMMWHNIAMAEDSIVLITEGRDAHLKGFNQIPLPEVIKEEVVRHTKELWEDVLV